MITGELRSKVDKIWETFWTGLRVSELSNIKIKDIDFSEREIKIMGKGSKERLTVRSYTLLRQCAGGIYN